VNSSERNRSPQAEPTPKEPATPFSLLLDATNDAAPPPTRDPSETDAARAQRSSAADDQQKDAPSDPSSPEDSRADAPDGKPTVHVKPADAAAAEVLVGDGQPEKGKSSSDPQAAKDAGDAENTQQQTPAAVMMQQWLADAAGAPQGAADAAQLAALKAAEKRASAHGANAGSVADQQDQSQASPSADGDTP